MPSGSGMVGVTAPARDSIALEVECIGCERRFWLDLHGDDFLAVGIVDKCFDGRSIRFEAERQRVATADHVLSLQNMSVVSRGRPSLGDVLAVALLRGLEGP